MSTDLEDHLSGAHVDLGGSSSTPRAGTHRATRGHRGKHRAPSVVPVSPHGRYAVVVGAAVVGAGAVAFGSAVALPSESPDDSDTAPAVAMHGEEFAFGGFDRDDSGAQASVSDHGGRDADRAEDADSPITEQPAEAYWRPPLDVYDLTSGFGTRWGMPHEGVDFAAPAGTPVYAAYPGEVVEAGWNGGFGQLVVIDHGDGVQTYYAHNSELGVQVGDVVSSGDYIAAVGNTGNSFGAHVHFEVHEYGAPVDPMTFMLDRGLDLESSADSVVFGTGPLH
ncbi:MAG: M23 family metallopeptidase [Stackebrandtia sp.]